MTRDRMRVVLDPATLQVDSRDILDMARVGQIHPRLIDEPLVSEAYLRDLDDIDPAFAVWAKARRQAFHDNLLQRLQAILHSDTLSGATRRECARAILNLDPTHEEACRALMRINAEMGDTAAALRAYNTLVGTARQRIRHRTVAGDGGAGRGDQAGNPRTAGDAA